MVIFCGFAALLGPPFDSAHRVTAIVRSLRLHCLRLRRMVSACGRLLGPPGHCCLQVFLYSCLPVSWLLSGCASRTRPTCLTIRPSNLPTSFVFASSRLRVPASPCPRVCLWPTAFCPLPTPHLRSRNYIANHSPQNIISVDLDGIAL